MYINGIEAAQVISSLTSFRISLVNESSVHLFREDISEAASGEAKFFFELIRRITSIVDVIQTSLLYEIRPSLSPEDSTLVRVACKYYKGKNLSASSTSVRQVLFDLTPAEEKLGMLADLVIKTVAEGQPWSTDAEIFLQDIRGENTEKERVPDTQDQPTRRMDEAGCEDLRTSPKKREKITHLEDEDQRPRKVKRVDESTIFSLAARLDKVKLKALQESEHK